MRDDVGAGPAPRARIELHCHTNGSFDSIADPRAVVRAAVARGLTHLAITDHDTIDVALRMRDAAPDTLNVIVGCEVNTRDGDLTFVHLERALPKGLSALEAIDAGREHGALIGIPHPFDRTRRSLLTGPGWEELEPLAARVDWIEVFNARVTNGLANVAAEGLARRYARAAVAVSDAHAAVEVGSVWTSALGDPGTREGLLLALAGAVPSVTEPSPQRTRLRGPFRIPGVRRRTT